MSDQSAKPYLIRALCEWCADSGFTPYLAVKVNAETRVPMSFVKDGEIVLNVSANATRRLTISNESVQFNARFNGASQEVSVPMAAVTGIFARETGYGFSFPSSAEPSSSELVLPPSTLDQPSTSQDEAAKPRAKPTHLQVIK